MRESHVLEQGGEYNEAHVGHDGGRKLRYGLYGAVLFHEGGDGDSHSLYRTAA